MKTQQKPQPSAVSQNQGDSHPPTTARDEFIAAATKHAADYHSKAVDAFRRSAGEAFKSIRWPAPALGAAIEGLQNSGMSRVIDDLKVQQKSWDRFFDSPAIGLAQKMIKEEAERSSACTEFMSEATKHMADIHLKSLDAFGSKAAEALKSIRVPSLALNSAIENLGNSGITRLMDDLKIQQQSWERFFDSPTFGLAQKMVKEHVERHGSFMPRESLEVRYLASPPHQHPLHPRDADRFDRMEKRLLELQIARNAAVPVEKTTEDESDFTFDDEGLFLSYKGRRLKPLTALEIVLCHKIYTQTLGYRFRTMELEETVYPGDYAEGNHIKERLKKLVSRFNAKIENQTGVEKFLLYSTDFVTRQV